jgi:hypothetical protein
MNATDCCPFAERLVFRDLNDAVPYRWAVLAVLEVCHDTVSVNAAVPQRSGHVPVNAPLNDQTTLNGEHTMFLESNVALQLIMLLKIVLFPVGVGQFDPLVTCQLIVASQVETVKVILMTSDCGAHPLRPGYA